MASKASCYASVFLTLLAILLSIMTQPALSDSTQDLIKSICRKTSNFRFCIAFFNQNVFAGATMESLGELAIRKSLGNATETNIFIRRLIDSSPKPQQDLYRICEVCFETISDQFTAATFAFSRRDYRSAGDEVERTRRPVNDCQNNVKISSELNKMSSDMGSFIGICLVILGLLPR